MVFYLLCFVEEEYLLVPLCFSIFINYHSTKVFYVVTKICFV